MPRVVILGTGTGVGKTYVTVALARALRSARPFFPQVLALKPVETGVSGARSRASSDARQLELASSFRAPYEHPLLALPDPVSPHLAARRARVSISPRRIAAYVRRTEGASQALHDTALHWVLIETAGGALSPLGPGTTNVDLARALEPSVWIVVAPDALGVLHDLRATLTALGQLARAPDFVVLTSSRPPDASTGTNARELERLGIAKPIAALKRGRSPRPALSRLVSALARRSR